MSDSPKLKPIIQKCGQIMIEDVQELILCKPRLIPLKSFTLQKLEKMQQEAEKTREQDNNVQENE